MTIKSCDERELAIRIKEIIFNAYECGFKTLIYPIEKIVELEDRIEVEFSAEIHFEPIQQ